MWSVHTSVQTLYQMDTGHESKQLRKRLNGCLWKRELLKTERSLLCVLTFTRATVNTVVCMPGWESLVYHDIPWTRTKTGTHIRLSLLIKVVLQHINIRTPNELTRVEHTSTGSAWWFCHCCFHGYLTGNVAFVGEASHVVTAFSGNLL